MTFATKKYWNMSTGISEDEKEILARLEGDIKLLNKELNETVKAIVDGEYSKFPILLAHEEQIAIAQQVIDKTVHKTQFNFSASTLEELVTRKIVLPEKEASLKAHMTTNVDLFCVLLVHPDSMKFIFSKK